MPSSLNDFPIFTSVRVVCRERMSFHELPNVLLHIDKFLGTGSIEKVYILGSLRLMKKFVAANDTTVDWRNVARFAAKYGHLDMLQWLPNFHADQDYWGEILTIAAACGHLLVVKWLNTHRQVRCNTDVMNLAAARGHLDVVKWLHDNRTEGCTTYAMNTAAFNGHTHVITWLNENRREAWGDNLIDFIVDDGQFEMAKWLHGNLQGRRLCSTGAIDNAAKMGRLDMVVWLYENRTEGYSTHALESAAQNGHLDVVKWLFCHEGDKRRYQCPGIVFGNCRFCAKSLSSRELYSVQYESLNDFVLKMAEMKGQQHVIEWVESLGEPESANIWRKTSRE